MGTAAFPQPATARLRGRAESVFVCEEQLSMANSTAFKLLRDAAPTISVGVVTANLLSLGSEIALLEHTGTKVAHIDVMDGCFCPMMTVGPPFIKAIRTSLLKDAHLMIDEPLEKVAEYVAVGADIVTIHAEAGSNTHRVLQKLGTLTNANDPERGVVRGVALNPGTTLEVLDPLLDELELILLLSVNPGFRGQKYCASTSHRIARVQRMIQDSGKDIILCVDGGITKENIAEVAATGADLIVTGSAVFDGKTPEANAHFMLEAVAQAARNRKSGAGA
jgi:ribulose-phosphate 3-epimerase